MPFDFTRLRRRPDVEAPNLQAWDATDAQLVDRALATGIRGSEIAVIGDEYGAISLALAASGLDGIRVHQDLATGRRALVRNAAEYGVDVSEIPDASRRVAGREGATRRPHPGPGALMQHELDADLLAGARLVLLQLPKALAELEEIADAVARWAADDVSLIAGGRIKHMTLAQNEVLGRFFEHVQPQRAERKSRLIVADGARAVGEPPFPVRGEHPEFGLTLVAHGAAFSGARLDIGTRVLLEVLAGAPRPLSEDAEGSRVETPRIVGVSTRFARSTGEKGVVRSTSEEGVVRSTGEEGAARSTGEEGVVRSTSAEVVVDLGCGTGALAAAYAMKHPSARVIATDRSASAAASARATMLANGLADRVEVTHDDAGSAIPDAAADVVLLNPPFHLGASVHTGAATRLFEAAARLVRPGGELLVVYNSSLAYKAELARLIGPTEQVRRTPKFTVTRSIRR